MGWRFQRRFGLIPGVTLNINKSGPSISFGFFGFSFNVGRRGTTTTISAPGTGLSHRTERRWRKGSQAEE